MVSGSLEMDANVKNTLTAMCERLHIPTRDDLEQLDKKIQALSARIAELEDDGGRGGA